MLIPRGSRLFRFLLSLVVRLRRSFGCIALALRARFALLWRSILTFARPRGQPQIRFHANDAPPADNNRAGERRPHIPVPTKVEEEGSESFAALRERGITYWENELSECQTLTLSHEFKNPLPATPEGGSQRYEPRRVEKGVKPPDVPAGQKTLLFALRSLPAGWRRYVHPEGNALFYHDGLHIFTESDIFDHGNDILFYATGLIKKAIKNGDVFLDEFTEIVLNLDGGGRWHYYFVDHSHRLLFWVQSVKTREDLSTGLQGINGYGHIRYLVEARYWYACSGSLPGMSRAIYILYNMESRSHCEYYPHNRTLQEGVFEHLKGMLNYAKTDTMTAGSSTSPFTKDELAAFSDLIDSLKEDKISNQYSIWVIARLMAFFTEDQFLNFCGQPYARLNADTPLFEQRPWNRGIAFNLTNWFLLWQPNEHAVRLQRVWVDGIIIEPRWKDFVNRLTTELGRYTIFSTVMLAVNFSFLAVPGVITVGSPASSIQIILYCSVVSTIGSIVFSLVLLSVYNDPELMGASLAAEVMKTLSRRNWGMARLAITHSLPIACLMWSILLFFVALAVQIFHAKELPTCATLGVEFVLFALLVLVSLRVMGWFYKDDNAGGRETSAKNDSSVARRQGDVEQGSKC